MVDFKLFIIIQIIVITFFILIMKFMVEIKLNNLSYFKKVKYIHRLLPFLPYTYMLNKVEENSNTFKLMKRVNLLLLFDALTFCVMLTIW